MKLLLKYVSLELVALAFTHCKTAPLHVSEMISKPWFRPNSALNVMLMVESVAVNLYQTSCEAAEAQEGLGPFIIAPLKVPGVLKQVVFGVNSITLEQKSLIGAGNLRTQI